MGIAERAYMPVLTNIQKKGVYFYMKIDIRPNWKSKCNVCGMKPTVGVSKLCGVCFFGEAEMMDWYDLSDKPKYKERKE
jgi:ribosomal protein L37E